MKAPKFYSYQKDEIIDYAKFPLQAMAFLIALAWLIGLFRQRFDGAILITSYLIALLVIMLFFIVPQWSSVAISGGGLFGRLVGVIWYRRQWPSIKSIQRIDFINEGDTIAYRSLIVIRSTSVIPKKFYFNSRIDGFGDLVGLLDAAAEEHGIARYRHRRRAGNSAVYFTMGDEVDSLR
jgi:hypothetical protein